MSEQIGVVSSVAIYPFKSMQAATIDGATATALRVGEAGFTTHGVADRQWLVEYDGYYVSQRGYEPGTQKSSFKEADGRLATVAVDIRRDHVLLTAPGRHGGKIEIPTALPESASEVIRVHDKPLSVLNEGVEGGRFLSRFLGRGVRLMRADPLQPRFVPELYQREGATNRVNAADSFPFLIANQASLDKLHHLAGFELGTVAMARYRPNVSVETDEAFGEDYWRRLSIADFIADLVKPCKRCPIPNNDPLTGLADGLSNKIMGVRAGDITVEGAESDRGLYFAADLNHQIDSIGAIVNIGDSLHILQRSQSPNVTLRRIA